MAEFPTAVYAPRTKANRSGVVYDALKTTHIYAEDIQKLDAEIVAVETILGTTPQGAFATVKAWLTALTSAISGLVIAFLDLSDVPASYSGAGGKVVAVNVTEDALEFITAPSGGGGAMTLLKATVGTSTNTAAEELDSVAITGLTAKDSLLIIGQFSTETQGTVSPTLRNSTDSLLLMTIDHNVGDLAVDRNRSFQMLLSQAQDSVKRVVSQFSSYDGAYPSGWATFFGSGGGKVFTTDWTGNWTLQFKSGGVVLGGTLHWSWKVYKVTGQ